MKSAWEFGVWDRVFCKREVRSAVENMVVARPETGRMPRTWMDAGGFNDGMRCFGWRVQLLHRGRPLEDVEWLQPLFGTIETPLYGIR